MKKSSLLFVIFFLFSSAVFAQNVQTNQAMIVQRLVTGTGPVTKAEYDEFWSALGIATPAEKKKVITSMRAGFVLTQEYQREIWICVEKAWTTRIAGKCEKAQKKLDVMKASLNQDQIAAVMQMADNCNRMIQSAARRENFKIAPNAVPIELNLTNVKVMRESLEKMLKRMEQVLRVEY